MTATDRIVDFALGVEVDSLPIGIASVASRLIADCVGVTVRGANTEVGQKITKYAVEAGGASRARVVVEGTMVPASLSALANGTMSHALDLDDDEPILLIGHPSAPVISALMAFGYIRRPSGADFLAAFIAGVEVEMMLGRIVNPGHYDSGWHATSTLGNLGATMACARLLGLDSKRTHAALGIAASTTSGLKQNFGTMTKPLHVGRAAEAAVLATTLAEDGFTANEHILDGPFGLFSIYGARDQDAISEGLRHLGNRYGLDDPGVSIKKYPSCSNTHPALDGILELRATGLVDEQATSIICRVAPGTERILQYSAPNSGLEAKFSMEYCLAVAIVYGPPQAHQFEDNSIHDQRVRKVMSAIKVTVDPSLVRSDIGVTTAASLTVSDRNGSVHDLTVLNPHGSRLHPLTDDELCTKFVNCCQLALGARAIPLFHRLLLIESENDVSSILDELTAG